MLSVLDGSRVPLFVGSNMTIQEWVANARKYDGTHKLRCSDIICHDGCPFYRMTGTDFWSSTCTDGIKNVRDDFAGDDWAMGNYLFEKYNIANKLDLI